MTGFDIIVVGAGMAGASLGAELAADARVLLLEMEDAPGYHATGRSVAFWEESYGGPGVQPLTTASLPFLATPDPDFCDHSLLAPRGALHIGREQDAGLRDAMRAQYGDRVRLEPIDAQTLHARIPGIRPVWTLALAEPSTADIDVAALHAACLRHYARRGGTIATAARFLSARREGGAWRVETTAGRYRAPILVNAAGAWADGVARTSGIAPLGIQPYRRTVVQLRVDPPPAADLPLILDLAGGFYFKPAGPSQIWLSPHDETPAVAGDAAPEELDVALAIARLESVVDWRIRAVERKWAGLRSFAPDRLPVYGYDAAAPGFFWFAGQGGFGIQTAPAAARLGAALLRQRTPHPAIAHIDPLPYAPTRFSR